MKDAKDMTNLELAESVMELAKRFSPQLGSPEFYNLLHAADRLKRSFSLTQVYDPTICRCGCHDAVEMHYGACCSNCKKCGLRIRNECMDLHEGFCSGENNSEALVGFTVPETIFDTTNKEQL